MPIRDICKPLHEQVEIDGLEVFYRRAGHPDSPTLLLLHGYPSSSRMFTQVISPLAEVADVVAPDLPAACEIPGEPNDPASPAVSQ